MPLLPGKKNIGKNIGVEMKHGKPKKQAIAIALSVARKGGADIPPPPKKDSAGPPKKAAARPFKKNDGPPPFAKKQKKG